MTFLFAPRLTLLRLNSVLAFDETMQRSHVPTQQLSHRHYSMSLSAALHWFLSSSTLSMFSTNPFYPILTRSQRDTINRHDRVGVLVKVRRTQDSRLLLL